MIAFRSPLAALLATFALGAPALAGPDTFPSRAVRIVVPSSVGGGADALARTLAAELQRSWPQGIAVENKTGAGGAIGTLDVVRAPADGHTLLVQNTSMVTNHAVAVKKPYDPQKDLTPIMMLGVTPLAVFVHAGTSIASFRDFVAQARAKPGGLQYGSCGNGTPHHFNMELLKRRAGLDLPHVGYKGCAPMINDVLAGQVPVGVATANLVAPHAASGRIKVLAVSGSHAYRLLPQVPTLESLGQGAPDFSVWYALMGPPNMPPQLVSRIAAAVGKVLDDPGVQAQLSTAGVEPLRAGGAELARLIRDETAQYARIAREAGIQPD